MTSLGIQWQNDMLVCRVYYIFIDNSRLKKPPSLHSSEFMQSLVIGHSTVTYSGCGECGPTSTACTGARPLEVSCEFPLIFYQWQWKFIANQLPASPWSVCGPACGCGLQNSKSCIGFPGPGLVAPSSTYVVLDLAHWFHSPLALPWHWLSLSLLIKPLGPSRHKFKMVVIVINSWGRILTTMLKVLLGYAAS